MVSVPDNSVCKQGYAPTASVGDPWHFGTDPDPDPRIRSSNSQIRMRIWDATKQKDPDSEQWDKAKKS